jgi:hypothetical protein
MDDATAKAAGAAAMQLADGERPAAVELWKRICARLGGSMPQAAAIALIEVAQALGSDLPWEAGAQRPEKGEPPGTIAVQFGELDPAA